MVVGLGASSGRDGAASDRPVCPTFSIYCGAQNQARLKEASAKYYAALQSRAEEAEVARLKAQFEAALTDVDLVLQAGSCAPGREGTCYEPEETVGAAQDILGTSTYQTCRQM